MFFRKKKTGEYEYLQIVEGYRDKSGKVKQKVMLTVGNLQELQINVKLDSLLESGARFSEKLAIISEHKAGKSTPVKCLHDVERAIYHTVMHRLFESGSDRSSLIWKEDVRLYGTEEIELQHLYRAMGFLGEPCKDQTLKSRFAPRCNKDIIEELLFEKRHDLFTKLEMVFFDTTSVYFEGEGGENIGKYGNSKDHRPDRKQMIIGVVIDEKGIPLCCEMWPGNISDITTLKDVVRRFQTCFCVRNFA